LNALYLTLFVSLGLAAGGLILFAFFHKQRDMDHSDRLSLLPLQDDEVSEPRKQGS
jgi:hypothetical protein